MSAPAPGTLAERVRYGRFLAYSGTRYVLRAVLNRCERAVGRHPSKDVVGFYFREHAWRTVGARAIHGITCRGIEGEGAGSQAMMIMSAIAFARRAGLAYLHTPFTHVAHAERAMAEQVAAWEAHFNLGAGETLFEAGRHRALEYNCFEFPGWRGDPATTSAGDGFETMVAEFRRKYRANTPRRSHDELRVAIHLRRGDVTQDSPLFRDVAATVTTATHVKRILDRRELPYRLRLFSQTGADIEALARLGAEPWIDSDPIDSMKQMIDADVLIMGQGHFSYAAGVLCEGVKLHDGFGAPLHEWIGRARDGSFDSRKLERKLSAVTRAWRQP